MKINLQPTNGYKKVFFTTFISVSVAALAFIAPILKTPLAHADVEGAFTYTIASGEATIDSYDELIGGTSVVIPATLGGNPVTAVGMGAFSNKGIVSIDISPSVETIGMSAFSDNLITSVFIPDTVLTLDSNMFYNNPLQSVTIGTPGYGGPAHLDIPSNAFSGLSISSLTLGPVVANILSNAFDSNQLTSLVIPDSVQNIGNAAFLNNQISSLDLGNITSLGSSAFNQNNLTSVFIPDSVTSLGYSMFENNPQLTSITIGTPGFSGTPTLSIESGMLVSPVAQLTSLSLGNNVASIGSGVFAGSGITSIVIPDSVTTLSAGAFASSQLSSVTIGSGVTSIPGGAFSGTQLTSVTIPGTVQTIEGGAFMNSKISSLTIENGVSSIGGGAFSGNQLVSVTIPSSVTSIDVGAFAENNLMRVVIEGTPTLGNGVFDQNGIDRSTIPTELVSYSPEWYDYIQANASLVSLYATNPSASYVDTLYVDADTAGGFIVNPASITINHRDVDSNSLGSSSTYTSPTFHDYKLSNTLDTSGATPTLDFSPYYRIGDTVSYTPLALAGFVTPSTQDVTLTSFNTASGDAGNVLSYIYLPVSSDGSAGGSNTDPAIGAPNTGLPPTDNILPGLAGAGALVSAVALWIYRRQG